MALSDLPKLEQLKRCDGELPRWAYAEIIRMQDAINQSRWIIHGMAEMRKSKDVKEALEKVYEMLRNGQEG